MIIIQIFLLSQEINIFDLTAVIIGHIIFGIAITQLLDWSWLKNLMSEKDKERMLKSYTSKDLVVDSAILLLIIGLIFVIISRFI